jgi:hypothetical protein
MLIGIRSAVVLSVIGLAACSHSSAGHSVSTASTTACASRATQIIAQNVDAITARHYVQASQAAERAARVSLSCAAAERSPVQRFSDRWRGANALVVSAELAHQANQPARAHALLHEGYSIMHDLRPPHRMSDLTSALIAEKLDGALRDMRGQWSYW